VFVERSCRALRRRLTELGRDQAAGRRNLADHRLEPGEKDGADVKLARIVPGENVIRDAPRIRIADLLDLSQVDMPDQMRAKVAAKLLAALLADRKDLHRLASGQKLPRMQAHELDHRRIEPAADAPLGTGHDQKT